METRRSLRNSHSDENESKVAHPLGLGLDSKLNEVMTRIDNLEAKLSTILQSKLDNLEVNLMKVIDKKIDDRISEVEKKFTKLVESKISAFENDFQSRLKSSNHKIIDTKDDIKNIVNSTLSDIEKSNERKTNLVAFNVAESPSNLKSEILKHDRSIFDKIIDTCEVKTFIKEDDVIEIKRLGKRGDKPRPVLVKFRDANLKKPLFRNLGKLKDVVELKQVRIQHDMSKEERLIEKERYEKLKEMNEKSENKIFRIRGPPWDRKIVKIH